MVIMKVGKNGLLKNLVKRDLKKNRSLGQFRLKSMFYLEIKK